MNADDLVSALTRRGLNASYEGPACGSGDGVETVRLRRPEDGATLAPYEISIEGGVPFWPWGSPIRPATDDEHENDPDAIAARLDRFVSARIRVRVSGG